MRRGVARLQPARSYLARRRHHKHTHTMPTNRVSPDGDQRAATEEFHRKGRLNKSSTSLHLREEPHLHPSVGQIPSHNLVAAKQKRMIPSSDCREPERAHHQWMPVPSVKSPSGPLACAHSPLAGVLHRLHHQHPGEQWCRLARLRADQQRRCTHSVRRASRNSPPSRVCR